MLPPRRIRPARLGAAGAGLALAVGALAACGGGGPDARDTANDLAAALTSGDVSKVPTRGMATDNQADLERIVKGLGEGNTQKVRVTKVVEQDGAATVTLSTRRVVSGAEWSYTTKASLVEADDQWEVEWEPSIVAPVKGDERLTALTVAGERGDILGAKDKPLVTQRPVVRVGIDKTRVKARAAGGSATELAELLDIDASAFRKRVEASGARAFVEGLVVRAGDAPADAALAKIPGAVGIDAELPLGPTRTFGQPLLGSVGDVTAEIIEDSKGALGPGDQVGLSGLQKRYDTQLRGRPGLEIAAIVSDPAVAPREVFTSEPTDGTSLRTTLDPKLQAAADDILGDVDPASAIVAVRPSTGELLAVASGPGGGGNDTATSGRYAPGSTFKIATALAFLRSGVTPSTKVPCTPTVTVDGRTFKNYSDYPSSALGKVSLTTAIANSCNTAMIATMNKAPQDRLADAAYALGLGRDVDLGVPAFLGSVPDTAKGTERAASMIGQGRIEASPLAMAVVAASVQDGRLVTPVLLPDLKPKDTSAPAKPLKAQEATSLADMMRAVVTDGSGRFLLDVPGPPVGAKTGTAEYGDEVPPRTHAWMIGTQGDLAVSVFVGDGDSGSATAGPLLEKLLRAAR